MATNRDATEFLKLSDSNNAARIAALKAHDPALVGKSPESADVLIPLYRHDLAVHVFPNVILEQAVFDSGSKTIITPAVMGGFHIMVRYLTGQSKTDQDVRLNERRKAREANKPIPKRPGLPAGLEDVELEFYSWFGD